MRFGRSVSKLQGTFQFHQGAFQSDKELTIQEPTTIIYFQGNFLQDLFYLQFQHLVLLTQLANTLILPSVS